MEREQLINLINRALRIEEEQVPTLTNSISSAVNFLEKDANIRDRVLKVMELLSQESAGHASRLKSLLTRIKKDKKDVY